MRFKTTINRSDGGGGEKEITLKIYINILKKQQSIDTSVISTTFKYTPYIIDGQDGILINKLTINLSVYNKNIIDLIKSDSKVQLYNYNYMNIKYPYLDRHQNHLSEECVLVSELVKISNNSEIMMNVYVD